MCVCIIERLKMDAFTKTWRICSYILVVLASTVMCDLGVSYDGYSLLRITPIANSQLQYLLQMNRNTSSGLDFWLRSTAVNNSADVMVSPAAQATFLQDLADRNIPYEYLIEDIGRLIADDSAASSNVPEGLPSLFAEYNSVEQISAILSAVANRYPDHVTLEEYGQSYEGRSLQLLKISTPSSSPKKAVWIQGGAHSREQIGTAVVLHVALKLATGLEETDVSALVNAFDWYLVPLVNPDGYKYCQTVDRLWRKTRSYNPEFPNCMGTDANRNWDFKWSDAAGSSTDPCSHNYAGSSAFSEPETKSIADYMTQTLTGHLLLFIDFHSYSQRWLTPWGYTSKLPPNYQQQKELAEVATSALETVHGTKYSVGSSGNILYTVSGGARDWVYGIVGARYSYVVEVRDKGQFGFLLPKSQILPTVAETWEGVKAMGLRLSTT